MKIIQKDLKHGIIKLLITNLDDLWALYNLIQISDKLYAKTTREVKVENIGRPSSRRLTIFLGMIVEKIFFDKEVSRLRVHGKVIDAPEDLNIQGKYHTINLIVGSSLTIIKDLWLKHQIGYLEALIEKENPLIIVAIDYEECCIAISRMYGIDVKAEITSRLPGKLETEKRNLALNYVKNNFKELFREIGSLKSVSNGGISGVYEAIRVGIVDDTLKKLRIVKESAIVNEVFKRLGSSTGDVSYGIDEVAEDAFNGAVDTILVCDETLRRQEPKGRLQLEKVIRDVEDRKGNIIIISGEHEGGAKLKSLGGIAALLRYSKQKY